MRDGRNPCKLYKGYKKVETNALNARKKYLEQTTSPDTEKVIVGEKITNTVLGAIDFAAKTTGLSK